MVQIKPEGWGVVGQTPPWQGELQPLTLLWGSVEGLVAGTLPKGSLSSAVTPAGSDKSFTCLCGVTALVGAATGSTWGSKGVRPSWLRQGGFTAPS